MAHPVVTLPGRLWSSFNLWRDKKELSKGYRLTTNNRMELMAVIAALEAMKKENLDLLIYSDSNYVVKAYEEGWLTKWIKTDFKGGKKQRSVAAIL